MENIDYLKKFTSLPHITADREMTDDDWGYAPLLYKARGLWHISLVHCEDMSTMLDFLGKTPEEVIDKAYDFYEKEGLI